jgi:hypothetical protein
VTTSRRTTLVFSVSATIGGLGGLGDGMVRFRHKFIESSRSVLLDPAHCSAFATLFVAVLLQNQNSTMGTNDDVIDFKFYRYDPSMAAAVIVIVLFLGITFFHSYKLVRTRTWFFIAFALGGHCEDNSHLPIEDTRVHSILSRKYG